MTSANGTLYIVGLVRDAAKTLPKDVKRLRKFEAHFARVEWLFIESDSTDSTLDLLEAYKREIPLFDYLTFGVLQDVLPSRIERIAHCRNAYVEVISKKIKSSSEKKSWVLVVDLDNLNRRLRPKDVVDAISLNIGNAYFPNQAGPYYDLFALRHAVWMPGDCFDSMRRGIESGMTPELAGMISIGSRMVTIDPKTKPFRVDSAFGGAGIYLAKDFVEARYSPYDASGNVVCEHVSFNSQVAAKGNGLWLLPSFINAGLTNHSFSQSRNYRFVQPIFSTMRKSLSNILGPNRTDQLYKMLRSVFSRY